MDLPAIFGIAVGLSMDALAVSMVCGAACRPLPLRLPLQIGGLFGLFQGMMPILGWCMGKAGNAFLLHMDHWIALLLLSVLGSKMLWDAVHPKEKSEASSLKLRSLLLFALATSVDAMTVGILLPSAIGAESLFQLLLAVALIAAVTFCICTPGVLIGRRFGSLLSSKAQLLGGVILIAMGVKIFLQHLFFA